ncbi:MAG: TIGR04086 family membrane protein [Clostridia bacterium]|nr:TIGR04086 family membrane protein [Clostridia bacterium]
MAKKKKKKKSVQNGSGINFILKKIGIGAAVGLAVFFILTAIATLVVYKKDTDPSSFKIIMLVISGFSGLICGIVTIAPIKRNGLVIGMASTLPLYFVIFAVVTFLNQTPLSPIGWAALGVMAVCGGIGGILANKK